MLGFYHLSTKIENNIIASYYNHLNSTIFKGLYFFLNNIFYSKQQKIEILHNFNRVQRTRYILLNAIKRYKIKKYSVNTCDLMMVPFTEYRDNFKIYITENNKIYTFYLPDLLKLWKNSIYESDFMVVTPKNLKNPYTNVMFDKNTLNYIYISAFKEMLIIPSFLTELFKVQFNKIHFLFNYGTILQENAISEFVSSNNLDLFKDIIIIKELYPTISYNIDDSIVDISKKKELIKYMNHILLIYYELTYSTNYVKKEAARLRFVRTLRNFNEVIPEKFRPIKEEEREDTSSEAFSDDEDLYNNMLT